MQLTLSPEEAAVLGEILGRELSDLRVEIRHTDSHEVRGQLRAREQLLARLLSTMQGPQAAEA